MKKTLRKLAACAVALAVAISATAGAAFAWFANSVSAKGFEASVAQDPNLQVLVKAGQTDSLLIAEVAKSDTESVSVVHYAMQHYVSFASLYGGVSVEIAVNEADFETAASAKNWSLMIIDMNTSVPIIDWDFSALKEQGETKVSGNLGTVAAGVNSTYFFFLNTDGSALPVTLTFTAVDGAE